MLENFRQSKIIIFGAGYRGKLLLEKLMMYGVTPAYFVDNNREIKSIEYSNSSVQHTFSVKPKEALLSEADKANLIVFITPQAPYYAEIERQLVKMGFAGCLGVEPTDHHWTYTSLMCELKELLNEHNANAWKILEVQYNKTERLLAKQSQELEKIIHPSINYGENKEIELMMIQKWGFYEYLQNEDFQEKYLTFIDGLEPESICAVNQILGRVQLINDTDTKAINLFTKEEQASLIELKENFYNQIHRISTNIYSYKAFLLPYHQLEPSVFWDKHGLRYVQNISKTKDMDIIDAGAFIGDSALILSPLTNKNVHSFEPVKENYDLLMTTMYLNKINNVVAQNMGLGANDEILNINVTTKASSTLKTPTYDITYTESVKMVTLDDYVAENNLEVGLIKTDVEGFEQELLKGAENTIKKFKPILLISIYHSPQDFFEIKPLIESWGLGYKFKIFKPCDGKILLETMLIAEALG